MCPYRTYLDVSDKVGKCFPCEICTNDEIEEKVNDFRERVGVKYRNFIDMKTLEETSIITNAGKDILVCPYIDNDVLSTICLKDAVQKLAKKVNDGIKWDTPEYTELHYIYSRVLRHKTEFNLMCELKKHMELHEYRRVETHVIEINLIDEYTSPDDLSVIDTLIKYNIENLEPVSKVKTIIPADKCLGFNTHHWKWGQQEAWLAFVNPKYITVPVPSYACDIRGPDGKYMTPRNYLEDPVIISEMIKMKEDKKTLFMIINTHEGSLENPAEYLEDLTLYPEWVKECKLLFTWSIKKILEEEDKSLQNAMIKAEFIQSKRYPGYLINLVHSEICDCDCCCTGYSINLSHTIPVNGCSLPIKRSPLQVTSPTGCKLELWESMFKFAWKTLQNSNDTDSSVTSDSETDNEQREDETEDSDDVWIESCSD